MQPTRQSRASSTAIELQQQLSTTKDLADHVQNLNAILSSQEPLEAREKWFASFLSDFSALPAEMQVAILAGSTVIIPVAADTSILNTGRLGQIRQLMEMISSENQLFVIGCLWSSEPGAKSLMLCKGLVDLLPQGARADAYQILGGPALEEQQKQAWSDNYQLKKSAAPALRSFSFYQDPGRIDQSAVDKFSATLQRLLANGESLAIRDLKPYFLDLEPAERSAVLKETPEILNAIDSDDMDTVGAYETLLRVLEPKVRLAVIRHLWEQYHPKDMIARRLADLLPLDQRAEMRSLLTKKYELQQKSLADPAPVFRVVSSDRPVDILALEIQLEKALKDSDADAILKMADRFKKLTDDQKMRIFSACDAHVIDLLQRREGIFTSTLTTQADHTLQRYRLLLRSASQACQVEAVVRLVGKLRSDTRPQVHANSLKKEQELIWLMPDIHLEAALHLAMPNLNILGTYIAPPKSWLMAYVSAVNSQNGERIRLHEKLVELVPPPLRKKFIKDVRSFPLQCGKDVLHFQAFARLVKLEQDMSRRLELMSLAMQSAFGIESGQNGTLSDVSVLRACREMIDSVPRPLRGDLNPAVVSVLPSIAAAFATLSLQSQQAFLDILCSLFQCKSSTGMEVYYTDLISRVTDGARRQALLNPQDAGLAIRLCVALESLAGKRSAITRDRFEKLSHEFPGGSTPPGQLSRSTGKSGRLRSNLPEPVEPLGKP
ncbi:hypothetical protein AAKU67_001115 [Oxalobacteraceae bacterium GrIS 2.11]